MDRRQIESNRVRPHSSDPLPLGLGDASGSHSYQRTLEQRRARHASQWQRQCQRLSSWLGLATDRLQKLNLELAAEFRVGERMLKERSRRGDIAARHVSRLIKPLAVLSAELTAIENRSAGRLQEFNGDRPWHALRDTRPSVGERRSLCDRLVQNLDALAMIHRTPLAGGSEEDNLLPELDRLTKDSLAAGAELKVWLRESLPTGGESLLARPPQ